LWQLSDFCRNHADCDAVYYFGVSSLKKKSQRDRGWGWWGRLGGYKNNLVKYVITFSFVVERQSNKSLYGLLKPVEAELFCCQ